LLEAKRNLEEAIEIDPDFADAYSYLSYCFFYGWFQLYPGFDDDLTRANVLAERGVTLDGKSAVTIAHLGWIQSYLRRHDRAIQNFEKAIALAPYDAEVYANFGQVLNYCGDPQRALEMTRRAFGLSIFVPPLWDFYEGHSHLLLYRYDEAVSRFLKASEQIPKFTAASFRLAVAYVEMDRHAAARDVVATTLEITPQYTLRDIARVYPYRLDEDRHRFLDGLRRAGLPE
jgi:tetratricopeptide (TPR) repeat protein